MASEATHPEEHKAPTEEVKPDASSAFLGDITGNSVIVKLHSGLEYHGRLNKVKLKYGIETNSYRKTAIC